MTVANCRLGVASRRKVHAFEMLIDQRSVKPRQPKSLYGPWPGVQMTMYHVFLHHGCRSTRPTAHTTQFAREDK